MPMGTLWKVVESTLCLLAGVEKKEEWAENMLRARALDRVPCVVCRILGRFGVVQVTPFVKYAVF